MKARTAHVVLTPENSEEYTFIKELMGEGNELTMTLSISLYNMFSIPPVPMVVTLDPGAPDDPEYWEKIDRIKKKKQKELEMALAELNQCAQKFHD